MNAYAPMPYASAPSPYAAPPPSYAPPSYASAPAYAAPIPLTPLVIPDDADALGGGGGGGGSITKFFALPLIVVLPILLPLILLIVFLPKFGKKPIKENREYEDMKPYYDDNTYNYQDYENNYMDDKPSKGNRRRREAEKNKQISSSNSALPSMSIAQVDRLTDVIFAAINSQECIQRLLCEVGSLSRSFSDTTQQVTKAVKDFVPESIKDSYNVFAKAEKCEQYQCGALKVHK
ncbi:uncharacterized protein LOC130689000 [Daphnia carinata]|uniref:uncharacterized protein LOC130689000 n=1 Tax=Daphnia carinata TaxID=120202 RepID=UPI0025803F96|nr:uncharacterized protein LOC130689000 [Daphnia carinata]